MCLDARYPPEVEKKKRKGWPDTDPYPFRDNEWPPSDKEKPDCEYVKNDKECIKVWIDDNEEPDYKYYLNLAWDKINATHEELQQAKDHIKWLENVGGEKLKMACGFDILFRDWVKRKSSAIPSDKKAVVK